MNIEYNNYVQLKYALQQRDVVFFLGAGASYDCGLPLGDEAAKEIVRISFAGVGLQHLWEQFSENQIAWPRFEVIIDIISSYVPSVPKEIISTFYNIGISSTQQFLAGIDNKTNLWLTTNFDNQIELALAKTDKRYYITSNRNKISKLKSIPLNEHLILKLHGDTKSIQEEKNLGVTIEQILRALPKSTSEAILHIAKKKPIVLIGYAARDPDLTYLLQNLIQNASQICWVNKGRISKTIKHLLSLNPKAYYYSEGADKVLGKAFKTTVPEGIRKSDLWRELINKWVIAQNQDNLRQSLASICLEINEISTLNAIEEIHTHIKSEDSQSRYWMLKRKADLAVRISQRNHRKISVIKHNLLLLSQNKNNQELKVPSLITTATLLRNYNNNEAANLAKKATQIAREQKNIRLSLNAEMILGTIYVNRGSIKLIEAINILKKCLILAKKYQLPILDADISICLATAQMRADKAKDAEDTLMHIKPVVDEIGIARKILEWRLRLGDAYRIGRQFNKAISINLETLKITQSLQDKEIEMKVSNNLAICYFAKGKVAKAERIFRKYYKIVEESGQQEVIGNYLYNFGWIREQLGMWNEAIPYFRKTIRIYNNYGSREREGDAIVQLAWCYFRIGKHKNSLDLIKYVQKKQLLPKGIYRRDIDLVKLVLKLDVDKPEIALLKIIDNFTDSPKQGDISEQRFHILMWLLEISLKKVDYELGRRIVIATSNAIHKSKFACYYCRLKDSLNQHGKQYLDILKTYPEEVKKLTLKQLINSINQVK